MSFTRRSFVASLAVLPALLRAAVTARPRKFRLSMGKQLPRATEVLRASAGEEIRKGDPVVIGPDGQLRKMTERSEFVFGFAAGSGQVVRAGIGQVEVEAENAGLTWKPIHRR